MFKHTHTDNTAGMEKGNTQREMIQSPTARFYYDRTLYRSVQYAASAGTDLRIARDTFCFQGLSLRMPMPKPERKNSSPVVTRSHFCEASNSSTAESQMKACSLLLGQGEGRRVGSMGGYGATVQWETTHSWHSPPPTPVVLPEI